MPKTPSTGWYHQPFLWRAAKADMIVQCTCKRCRRSEAYLASDLVQLFHRDAVVGQLWAGCSNCGKRDRWVEQERYPLSDDVGHLVVRRLKGFEQVPIWENQYYAPASKGPGHQAIG